MFSLTNLEIFFESDSFIVFFMSLIKIICMEDLMQFSQIKQLSIVEPTIFFISFELLPQKLQY